MNLARRMFLVTAVSLSTGLAASIVGDPKLQKVDFSQVWYGHSLVRDETDRTNAAVIWNQEGLRAFLEKYPIPIAEMKPAFDGKKVLVVVFSDRLHAAFCDGVSRVTQHGAASFYSIDLYDAGVAFMRAAPPQGKKYSSWVIVSMDQADAIANVRVREPVEGGLSQQFGKP